MTGPLILAATLSALSLEAALQRVGESAPVIVARAEAEREHRQADLVRVPASPVLSVGTTRYSARESASVSQEIRWGGEKHYAVRAAEETASAADANTERVLRDARRLVRQAWTSLAAAEDAETIGGAAASRAREVVDFVHARFEGGRAPRLDEVRAAAEAGRLAAAAAALEENRRASWAHLASLLGLDPASEGATDRERLPPLEDDAVTALVEGARPAENPALIASARALAAAEATRELSRRRSFLPGLSLAVGVNANDPGLPGPDPQATLSLTLPIGARGSAALHLADAQVKVLESQLERTRRELAETLEVVRRRVRAGRAQYVALDRNALPAAEEAARLTREAYTAGRGDIFRVIDAERAFLDVRSARLQVWADLKAAEAELYFVAGEASK